MASSSFSEKYGPWAFVAGGSLGLGSAYCDALARKGLNIVLAARRLEPLEEKARELRTNYGVEVRTVQADLATSDLLSRVGEQTEDLEVGMLVLNAALATITPFLDMGLANELRKIDINCRSTVMLSHYFGGKMRDRRKGGIIIMSSGAGLVGAPYAAVYSATKSFDIKFAQALWYELKEYNIDVMTCIAGLTRTPEIAANHPDLKGYMEPEDVVDEVLRKLGTRSSMSPGKNKFLAFLMTRLMPAKTAIGTLAKHHKESFMD